MARVGSEADRDQAAEQAESRIPAEESTKRANRRAFPRHAVDCPVTVIPVAGIGQIAGQLADLSLGGCLVRLEQRYLAGMLVRVEIQFQLRGIAFRILGVTVGTRGAQSFAIRFLDVPERRREELAQVLSEIAEVNATGAAEAAGTQTGAEEDAACRQANESGETAKPSDAVEPVLSRELPGEAAAVPPPVRNTAAATGRERRSHDRHAVDTSVRLLLIRSAIAMSGRIANLSLGGCRIRTDERFNVGIFVRVETEFYLHGLPFRIAGVSQAIQDRNTIGIRFLDMSERCRAQLVELIAEIEEAHAIERDEVVDQSKAQAETKLSE